MIRKDESPKKITFTEIAKGLNQGLESADPARLAGLQTLRRVRAIKDVCLEREQARLAKKYGANHPRLREIAARRKANAVLEREVELQISRAQTPAVAADPNAWTLHGYVRDAGLIGQQDLTVALYDQNGRWIEELGQACTDTHGYFRLTVAGAEPKAEGESVEVATEKLSRTAGGRTGLVAYIHVTNGAAATPYVDPESITPKLGAVLYREIILAEEGGECAPPEGGQAPKPRRGSGKDKAGRKSKSQR